MSQLTSESLDDRIIETSEQKRLFDDYVRELPP
jgi:hypothetical protein